MKTLIALVCMLMICYTSAAQTKFVYNTKGAMVKTAFAGNNGCPQQGAAIYETVPVAVEQRTAAAQTAGLKATPNPATAHSRVEGHIPADGPAVLKLANASGMVLFERTVQLYKGSFIYTHNVQSLSSGTYFWILQTNSGVFTAYWVKM